MTDARSHASLESDEFYASLPSFDRFTGIVDPHRYTRLPSDWLVGIADAVDSTKAIAEGRYKAVNTAGAAVLAAMTNALPHLTFPFVFGGDGASLAVPGRCLARASDALARTATWAREALDLDLRVAVVPVTAIRAAGLDVRVARYAASPAVSYAMVSGGGLTWADAQTKAGNFAIPPAPSGCEPDLAGLFCGFAPIRSQNGVILSLIVVPGIEGSRFADLVHDLLALLDGDGRSGRPLSDAGPMPPWLGSGVDGSTLNRRARVRPWARGVAMLKAIRLRMIHSSSLVIGGAAPARYRRQLVRNTDFRKFDDGLRMTVDCTPAVAEAVEARLAEAGKAGVVRFGTHRQGHANLTCYVPSRFRDDHVHFIDGAAGGYAAAAAKLKAVAA